MRGRLTPEQSTAITWYVKGKRVHDLGAGDLILSSALLELGARTVVAVDERYRWDRIPDTDSLYLIPSYFDRYVATDPEIDVAFVSWPEQYAVQGLPELCRRARVVVYLGSNFDGVVCGSFEFWSHIRHREVLDTVPDSRNTLVIYGKTEPGHYRTLLPEEYAALRCQTDPIHRYGSLDGRELTYP